MAKTPELKRYCQYCKSQTNNPSYCKLHSKYTGRKQTCDSWKAKKVK